MEHVGIVVDDLAAATEFFVVGLELQGEAAVEGRVVDRVVGLEGVRTEVSFMQTPDGHGRLELIKFHTPSDQGDNPHAQANTPASRTEYFEPVAFAGSDPVAPLLRTKLAVPSSPHLVVRESLLDALSD